MKWTYMQGQMGALYGYFKHIFDYMNGIGSNKYY